MVSDLTPGPRRRRPTGSAPTTCSASAPASTSLAQLTVREPVGRVARPRHRLRRPGAAPGRAQRARSSPPTSTRARCGSPGSTPRLNEVADQRRRPRRLVLRAGRGRALRPDRHQPAVRDLAGDRRAAGLPRLRAARRPRRRGHRPRRARPPHRRRLVPGARQLGGRATASPGTSGSPAGSPTAATRWSCSARSSTRRRTSSCGSRTPGMHGGAGLRAPLRHLARLVRGAGHRGGRLRLDQPAPHRRPSGPSVRFEDWPYDVEQPIAPAIARLGRARRPARPRRRRCWPPHLVVARRRAPGDASARPAPRTPSTIVLRQQRGLRRARQVDTVEAALVGACDGDLTVGPILDALGQLARRGEAATTCRAADCSRGLLERDAVGVRSRRSSASPAAERDGSPWSGDGARAARSRGRAAVGGEGRDAGRDLRQRCRPGRPTVGPRTAAPRSSGSRCRARSGPSPRAAHAAGRRLAATAQHRRAPGSRR